MIYIKKEVSERNVILDIIKGVAITLMVIGHCIQYGSGVLYLTNNNFFENVVFKFIYSFHMPLFMLVSGYLFWYSIKKYNFKNNIKKRVNQLLVPIICFSLLRIIIECFVNKSFAFSINIFIYNFWFLWAVLFCSVIVLIVNKLFKDNLILYFIIYCLIFLLPDVYNIQLYSYMYIFFLLGYLFNKYNLKDSKYNNSHLITIISGVLFLILFCFYDNNAYIYTTGYCILNKNILNQMIIDLYRTIIGLMGSIFIISLIKELYKNFKFKIISNVGKYSLGIYIISEFIFTYIFPNFNIYINNINYLYIIIETILVIIISVIITKIIQKNKVLNKLFLGGR